MAQLQIRPKLLDKSKEDYVIVSSSSSKGKDSGKEKGEKGEGGGALGLETGQGGGQICVESSKVDSGMAGVVSTAAASSAHKAKLLQARASLAAKLGLVGPADEAVVRRMLLLQRSFGSSAEKSAERKHYYTVGGFALASAETTLPLSRIIGGTASNTRTTNTVRLHRCNFRMSIFRQPTGTSSVAAGTPILRWVIWRDKIPATPGTAPTLWGTDANPPASTTLMFSRLGSANVVHNQTAVFNPVTALDYHVYETGHMDLNDKATYDFVTPATAFGLPAPQKWFFHKEFSLHNVVQNYASYTATAADVNDVYITFITDFDYSNQGYGDNTSYSSDLEFEDMQDGE